MWYQQYENTLLSKNTFHKKFPTPTGFFIPFLSTKNHLLKVLSDQLKCKAKTKVNSKCSNKEMKDVADLNHQERMDNFVIFKTKYTTIDQEITLPIQYLT